jgi:pimeloyl-ACP methyl ester carboxylesterase
MLISDHIMQRTTFWSTRARGYLSALGIASVFCLSSCGGNVQIAATPQVITPLAFSACPNVADAPFQCANAIAPLDYSQPDNGQTVTLAVVKHPATNQAQRLGAIFFNPGGPGGAGTDDLPAWISKFPAALVARFDLISWDPRGIGRSTAVQCFASENDESAFKAMMAAGYPIGDAQVQRQAQLQSQFNQNCLASAGLALLQHVSTEDTARDLDWLRQAAGEPNMNFLGVSYGTVVGATYANLFPKNVRSMVLDGNIDVDGYFGNAPLLGTSERMSNDTATGQTFSEFIRLCAAAGKPNCQFSNGDATATMNKYTQLSARLAIKPVAIGSINVTQALMLYVSAEFLFTVQAFDSFPGWNALDSFLQSVWVASGGDTGTVIAPVSAAATSSSNTVITHAAVSSIRAAVKVYESDGASSAVQCGESPNPRDLLLFPQVAALAQARAGILGSAVAWFDAPCSSWPATASHIYAGPWNAPTSPILVIGNIFDPSTAYSSSQEMAQKLANARLLTVNGYGHTVLLNSSICASNAESAYFIDGTVPAVGLVCQQDAVPFSSP